MYESVFTETPFYGETIQELFDRIVNSDIYWPTDIFPIEDSTKDLIEMFLKKDPEDRWGDHNLNEIKEHSLFKNEVNWSNITEKKFKLMKKSQDLNDTRYFDHRSEFYDHDVDLMSELSIENFSKISESDVFHNYQYSSPSFSNKIRLSTSINLPSDESRDSNTLRSILENSNTSDITSRHSNLLTKFKPHHRSSLLETSVEPAKGGDKSKVRIKSATNSAKPGVMVKGEFLSLLILGLNI